MTGSSTGVWLTPRRTRIPSSRSGPSGRRAFSRIVTVYNINVDNLSSSPPGLTAQPKRIIRPARPPLQLPNDATQAFLEELASDMRISISERRLNRFCAREP